MTKSISHYLIKCNNEYYYIDREQDKLNTESLRKGKALLFCNLNNNIDGNLFIYRMGNDYFIGNYYMNYTRLIKVSRLINSGYLDRHYFRII